jgi:DNA repair protein RadC
MASPLLAAPASSLPPAVAAARPLAAVPAGQRPRERLLALGGEPLADAELVALLLGTGRRGMSALAVAHDLLAAYEGPYGLARAEPVELARRPGVGLAKATRICAAFALARRVAAVPPGQVVSTTADLADQVRPYLAQARRERVVLVVLDHALRVRRTCVVYEGSVDECLLPVREVLTATLAHDGSGFAVAHNHPSGDPTPSGSDERVTAALARGAEAVGLDFHGHLVVTDGRWVLCDAPGP